MLLTLVLAQINFFVNLIDSQIKVAHASGPAVSFKPVVNLPIPGGTSWYYETGALSIDVNNDGNLDIVSVNYDGDNASVMLGNGDGTFATAVNYAVGTAPDYITSADLNGDSNLDLIVSNSGSANVSVLIGNGDGTFATAVNYTVGTNPTYKIVVQDLNNDSKLDLAVGNATTNNISILIGNGDGTFNTQVNYPATGSVTGFYSANLDNNSSADLIGIVGVSGFDIFLNNSDGTFASVVNYPVSFRTDVPAIVQDFNGDSFADLSFASSFNGGTTLAIFINNGDGTFASEVDYTVGDDSIQSAEAIDLNNDGKLDIATTNYNDNNVSVLLGNGDGTFAPAVNYAVGGRPITPPIFVDFNNDGNKDIAVANYSDNNVSILTGNGDGTFNER